MSMTLSNFNTPIELKIQRTSSSTMACRITLKSMWIFRISRSTERQETSLPTVWETPTWALRRTFARNPPTSRPPALAASFYVEFPTGDASQQLGSGLNDYWLNLIAQKSLSPKTRITGNLGYLFAGNTSTGAMGTQPRGGMFSQAAFRCSTIFAPRSRWEPRSSALTRKMEIWEIAASGHGWGPLCHPQWVELLLRHARR